MFFCEQCKTFLELVESEEDSDSKSVTAVGILGTIGCIVDQLREQEEVRSCFIFIICISIFKSCSVTP